MMKLFSKGQLVRSTDYENARYIYALCGTNLITFRVYKTLKSGDMNPLWQATTTGLVPLQSYIFEFSHYFDKNGVERYNLYNIHTGGVKIDNM